MTDREQAEYRTFWREKNLRESLSHHVIKKVSERKNKKQDSQKRGGFLGRFKP